jgi:hypothetical protein
MLIFLRNLKKEDRLILIFELHPLDITISDVATKMEMNRIW